MIAYTEHVRAASILLQGDREKTQPKKWKTTKDVTGNETKKHTHT